MNTNRSSKNWLIDAALFGGFIVLFFLELTGLALHQWLGIAAGALAAYHLAAHWSWVKGVAQRFFGRATWEARLYLLVDTLLFSGLAAIVLSGVVISSWLNLPTNNVYLALSTFHIVASQATLLLIVFKIAIHWEWIVKTTRRLFARPVATGAGESVSARARVAAPELGRRDFIRLMGVVGGVAAFSLFRTTRPLAEAAVQLLSAPPVEAGDIAEAPGADAAYVPAVQAPEVEVENAEAGPEVEAPSAPTPGGEETAEAPAAATVEAQSAPTAQPSSTAMAPTARPTIVPSTATPEAAKVPTLCTKLCPRGQSCSYPGRCRSYRDRNGNGHCDLAEC